MNNEVHDILEEVTNSPTVTLDESTSTVSSDNLGTILNYISNLPPGIKQLVMPAAIFLLLSGLTYGAIAITNEDHLAHFTNQNRTYALAKTCNNPSGQNSFTESSVILPAPYLKNQFNDLEEWFFNANLGDEFTFHLPVKLQDEYTLLDVTYQKREDANGTLFLDIIPPGIIFSKKPNSTNLGFHRFSDGSKVIIATNSLLFSNTQQPSTYDGWLTSVYEYFNLIDMPQNMILSDRDRQNEGYSYEAIFPTSANNPLPYNFTCSDPNVVELTEEDSEYNPLRPNIMPLNILNSADTEFEQKAEDIHRITETPFQSLGAAIIRISRETVNIEDQTVVQSQQLSNAELILTENELIVETHHQVNSTSLQVITLTFTTEDGEKKENVVVFTSMDSYPVIVSKNNMIESAAITYNSTSPQGMLRFGVNGENVTNVQITALSFNDSYNAPNITPPEAQKQILEDFLRNFPTIDISALPLQGTTSSIKS